MKHYFDNDQTGDDLKITLSEEDKKIIVIVWYKNLHKHWYQNRLNQEARGTLMSLIRNYHPEVLYHEADMSPYNRNAYTYEALSKELGIDLDQLDYGPMVVIMFDQRGEALRSEKGTLSLITSVDKVLHQKEDIIYGIKSPLCNIDFEIEAANEYKIYNPWDDYDYYRPTKDEIDHDKRMTKTVEAKLIDKESVVNTPLVQKSSETNIGSGQKSQNPSYKKLVLREPEKSFSERRRRRR